MKTFRIPMVLIASLAMAGSPMSAHAGGGAPVPENPGGGPPSGRPGEILDDSKCQDVWKTAAKDGDSLTLEQAGPYVANFQSVDSNSDNKISNEEFKAGCAKGMVQKQASKPANSPGGQTPDKPEQ